MRTAIFRFLAGLLSLGGLACAVFFLSDVFYGEIDDGWIGTVLSSLGLSFVFGRFALGFEDKGTDRRTRRLV
ncbi:hypothetical protein [Dokdonella sp.]|uniref:hypothetical protein n=1 Tax=Dokdonella sp. TaxID=2291710 RepID=UPI001B14AE67|nr:hypothetical protein [Dokdonella sp.]MBO9663415.1 hypothetical protein [Dokdonella sp.]